MTGGFAKQCALVQADLAQTAQRVGENDPIGQAIQAQGAFVGLFPQAVEAIRMGPIDSPSVNKALKVAAKEAFGEVAWAEVRKWLAVMVVGGISLATASTGAGYLIGRSSGKHDVAVLNQTLSLNGDEARELARLIEANRGNMGASIRSARKTRDSAGREIVQPLFWAPGQTSIPVAR